MWTLRTTEGLILVGQESILAVMKPTDIAKVSHETNRAYCQVLSDYSQPSWETAPEWQRISAIKGVEFHLANPGSQPSHSHEEWLKEKEATGWKYGPVKDPEKKEHPCFVPYDKLPPAQKIKDDLFVAIVNALRNAE
jgi:hypothetical protein